MPAHSSGFVRALKLIAAAAALSALAACAPAKVGSVQSYPSATLPRPDIVIVTDFVATPERVELDRGLGARLRDVLSGATDQARQSDDDRKVTAAIAATLVAEIQKLGLPARASNDAVGLAGSNRVIIAGQILSIDEGNRTRRNVIGLGAGSSSVEARAEIYYDASNSGARLMESFAADAESGRKPGAAETMGAGAATGRVVESAAVGAGTSLAPGLSADVAADSERMAKAIAKQIAHYFVSQGWIPADAAR